MVAHERSPRVACTVKLARFISVVYGDGEPFAKHAPYSFHRIHSLQVDLGGVSFGKLDAQPLEVVRQCRCGELAQLVAEVAAVEGDVDLSEAPLPYHHTVRRQGIEELVGEHAAFDPPVRPGAEASQVDEAEHSRHAQPCDQPRNALAPVRVLLVHRIADSLEQP